MLLYDLFDLDQEESALFNLLSFQLENCIYFFAILSSEKDNKRN